MVETFELLAHPKFPIYVREFEEGARRAAQDKGISVVIDNFRASNTILALFKYTSIIKPVLTVEEAQSEKGFVKVGEDDGSFEKFDHDNSPVNIENNPDEFRGKKVVIRTTNGTRGLINAIGSAEIIMGSFRNLSTVVEFCHSKLKEGYPINFIPMGSKTISRIEDVYGAKMMYYSLIKKMGDDEGSNSDDNPWLRDWIADIKAVRRFDSHQRLDREYCILIDQTNLIPRYNVDSKMLELLN